jgi:LysR family transcriptional regulator, flagellar master operon regulator
MQLEQIITFLDLVETRSFGLTAERLGLTQSTVSARISALERALGSTLFYRGRSGTSPTPAGRRFEEHARSITASWGLARQALGTINRFDGSLRIASQVSLTDTLLFDWMDQIRIELPKVALHVESDYSPQMIDDLAFGNLDIGVLYAPRYLPEIQFEQIMIQQFVLVSSTAERLAEVEPSSYVRAGYTPAIEKAHSEMLPELSRPRISVGLDLLAVMHLKRNGGSAYVPQHAVHDLVKSRTARSVTDAPVIAQPVFAAVHIRRRTNAEVRKALKILHGLLATGRYGDTGANNSDQPRH